ALGLRAETACGLEEHVRCGLAGETRALEVDAVDPDIEEPRNARRLEHRRAISARRDDGRLDVVIAQGLGKGDRARERIDTVPRELLGEVTVLAPREAVLRRGFLRIVGVSDRNVDAACREERRDAFPPRL